MSDRIHKTWTVLKSIESSQGDYCVDIFSRPDGTYGFEEFRRDSEDMGKWTGIQYHSELLFNTELEAMKEAKECIEWLSYKLK